MIADTAQNRHEAAPFTMEGGAAAQGRATARAPDPDPDWCPV